MASKVNGEKPLTQRLRDYLRLLSKRESMAPKVVADIEAKINDIKEQLAAQKRLTTGTKAGTKRPPRAVVRDIRPKSELDRLRALVRTKRENYINAGQENEQERVAILAIQSQINSIVKKKAEEAQSELRSSRLQRRQEAKQQRDQED